MISLSRSCFGAALAVVLAAAPVVRAAEPDKLLPADSDSVLSVNIRQIIGSDIIKKYALEQIKQTLQGNDAQKFLSELGLDPLKDIDTVVVGASGKDQTDMKVLVIVHGKFDPNKLFKAAEAQTKKDGDHFSLIKDGKDVMFKYQPDNGNPMYGTVVNESTIVVGTEKKLVSAAVATADKGGKPAISKDLSSLIAKMDDKTSMWMASVVKGKLDNVKLPGGPGTNPALQAQLAKMEAVTAVIQVNTDVTLDVTLGMKDEDAATEMGKSVDELLQTVKGAIPFLAAQNPQMKPLVEVAKTLKSNVKDKSIVVTAKLSGTAIGKMLNPAGSE